MSVLHGVVAASWNGESPGLCCPFPATDIYTSQTESTLCLKNVVSNFYQFLMTKLCQTFIISLWIVNRFEKHILRIWNIASLLQWLLNRLPYCQSSKSPPLARTQARRCASGSVGQRIIFISLLRISCRLLIIMSQSQSSGPTLKRLK